MGTVQNAAEHVQVYEDKADMFAPILDVSDISLGINFWHLLSGDFKVNMLKIENGNFDVYRYVDGTFNLTNALSGEKDLEELKQEYNVELEKIELTNLDIIKYDEGTRIHAETYIESATSKFRNSEDILYIRLNSNLILNVIDDGDSTVFKKKHFDADTELQYNKDNGYLTIFPSDIQMQNAEFKVEGSVDVINDFDLDIAIHGGNQNFNLLIAFAPEELIPTLEQYDNAGNIRFDAMIRGKSFRGQYPKIDASFGCNSAYFRNPVSNKKLEEISFNGYFTNGDRRNISTMKFVMENVNAKPEAGTFKADLKVTNFESPEIDMKLESDFDLDFLAKFLNVSSLQNLGGDVSLKMNFHDIVDLQNPEKSLKDFSQSYFTELDVKNLTFKLPNYPIPFDSIDIRATMDGNKASIEYIFMNIGESDLTVRGEIDDFPAIIHQSADTINADLFLYSSLLDIQELSSQDSTKKPFEEKLENMRLNLAFKTTAKDLIHSPNLPQGDFFVKKFYGKPQNYPHTLKNINAHILIHEEELEVLEVNGKVDKSDVHYAGRIYNYPLLLQDTIIGELEIDFSVKSDLIRLNDLFTYKGENYLPPDYRREEIKNMEMFGNTEISFNNSFESAKVYFDQFNANLTVHDMNIEDIHGKLTFARENIKLDGMTGKLGNTSFSADMDIYTGSNDSIRKATNTFALYADFFDYDQLSNYKFENTDDTQVNRDSLFNIYELPFTDLNFALDIKEVRYHKHIIHDLNSNLRMAKNHFIYVDTLQFHSSGGFMDIKGYFDGSDSDSIYFYPDIMVSNVDLEEIMFRFDNFGQDYILSENLLGRISGNISGKLKVHPDLVPSVENSVMYMDFEIINGSLRNYDPLNSLSDYFKNKNLSNIRFDTLTNNLELNRGTLIIPNMTINSTIGHLDISGQQDLESNMEYYIKVPMKLVSKAAWSKLFGKKKNIKDSTNIDAIQYKDSTKKRWYVSLKLVGNADDYTVSLGKKKKEKG